MENRIKECQLDLFADRTSAATMRAHQLRLWLASMAYVLLCALRRIGLKHTQFADATCGTIRLRLLKIGVRAASAVASSSPWRRHSRAKPSTPSPISASRLLAEPTRVTTPARIEADGSARPNTHPPTRTPPGHQAEALLARTDPAAPLLPVRNPG